MSSLVSFPLSSPAEWEMFLLNAANVLLGLVVVGFLLLLVGESIVEILGRRRKRLPNLAAVRRHKWDRPPGLSSSFL
jgi:hypothetical protein